MFSDGNVNILSWSWAGDLLFQVLVVNIQASCPGLHLNDLVSSEILPVIFFGLVLEALKCHLDLLNWMMRGLET